MSADKVILCLGDSLTKGDVSCPWVDILQERTDEAFTAAISGFGGEEYINAGRNGDMAVSILRRLPVLLARNPSTQAVILQCGTNDVLAAHGSTVSKRDLLVQNKLPLKSQPSLDSYLTNVTAIIGLIPTSCRVAVLSIPPISQDLTSSLNAEVQRYNAALQKAVQLNQHVLFLDLYKALAAHLHRSDSDCPYVERDFGTKWALLTVGLGYLRKRYMGHSWDDISSSRGLELSPDHLHLNDTAGKILVSLLKPFVDDAAPIGQQRAGKQIKAA